LSKLHSGDRFPDLELPDQSERPTRLGQLTRPSALDQRLAFGDSYPLVVMFYRGFFCPRNQQQMRLLVQWQPKLAVSYSSAMQSRFCCTTTRHARYASWAVGMIGRRPVLARTRSSPAFGRRGWRRSTLDPTATNSWSTTVCGSPIRPTACASRTTAAASTSLLRPTDPKRGRSTAPTRKSSGQRIFITSKGGSTPAANQAAYAASKAGLEILVRDLAEEYRQHGININAVCPSIIDTPANRKANPDADYTSWVQPQSIAAVIGFLASDAARDIHGAIVPVFGRA